MVRKEDEREVQGEGASSPAPDGLPSGSGVSHPVEGPPPPPDPNALTLDPNAFTLFLAFPVGYTGSFTLAFSEPIPESGPVSFTFANAGSLAVSFGSASESISESISGPES